jgi:hypothetical protein
VGLDIVFVKVGNRICWQVVSAFMRRIAEVNPVINAAVDCRFAAALEEADHIDAELAGLGPGLTGSGRTHYQTLEKPVVLLRPPPSSVPQNLTRVLRRDFRDFRV